MSTTVTILGLSSGPLFGAPDMTYGAGESFEYFTASGESHVLQDGSGTPIAAAITQSGELTMSYTAGIKGTIPSDTPGTSITIDGITAYLKSIKILKKRGDFATIQIEAVKWHGIPGTASSGN